MCSRALQLVWGSCCSREGVASHVMKWPGAHSCPLLLLLLCRSWTARALCALLLSPARPLCPCTTSATASCSGALQWQWLGAAVVQFVLTEGCRRGEAVEWIVCSGLPISCNGLYDIAPRSALSRALALTMLQLQKHNATLQGREQPGRRDLIQQAASSGL